jgi:hypothetical protein
MFIKLDLNQYSYSDYLFNVIKWKAACNLFKILLVNAINEIKSRLIWVQA